MGDMLNYFNNKNNHGARAGFFCSKESFNSPLSNSLMAFIMLSTMYSFGTFGLLNLFGIRQLVQAALIAVVFGVFLIVRPSGNVKIIIPAFSFFGLYAIGELIYGGQLTWLIEATLSIVIMYLIHAARPKQIFFLAKTFVFSTCFFCILVLIAFCAYKIYPHLLFSANFHIYDSTVGNARLHPSNLIDWISFTSGDGFVFGGENYTRMKGYSNEPSSTTVHYLAPAILAFAIGGVYRYLGIFIVLINILLIASFTSHIIILLSFVIYFLAAFFRRNLSLVFYLILLLLLMVIVNPGIVFKIFEYSSGLALNYFDFDLIARKMVEGNLGERNQGITYGLYLMLISPFGYSKELLGAGTGLYYLISSSTGWIGCIIFSIFIYKLIVLAGHVYLSRGRSALGFSICLLFSLLLIVLFVSGYGWGRLPGVIMLMLIYRLLDVVFFLNRTYPKSIVRTSDGVKFSLGGFKYEVQ
jgi:hypothetical protein